MARRRIEEMTGMTPAGDPRIPYDQTDPLQQMGAPAQAAGPTGAALPGAALPPGAPDIGAATAPTFGLDQMGGGGSVGAPDGGGLAALFGGDAQGAPPAGAVPGGSTDDLTGNDLAALSQPLGDLQSPEDQQIAQMDAALDDPATPPEVKAQLMQQLDLAARRRLAGLGGGQPQGGGM